MHEWTLKMIECTNEMVRVFDVRGASQLVSSLKRFTFAYTNVNQHRCLVVRTSGRADYSPYYALWVSLRATNCD